MPVTEQPTTTDSKQFYSQRAIGIATYFGGPLAAGILVRRNYINLGNELYGKHALSIGILSTLLLFGGLFSVPDHVIDKIPNAVFPAVYTLIIYLLVEKLQGKALKEHKENNGTFYSAWKAAGTGFVCMVILLGGILAYAYTSVPDFDATQYDKGLDEIAENEKEALKLYEMIGVNARNEVVVFIKDTGIPNWKKNLTILERIDKIEGLPDDLKNQNEILKEYSRLRIQCYELIQMAVSEDTDSYDDEIEDLVKKIDEQIAKL